MTKNPSEPVRTRARVAALAVLLLAIAASAWRFYRLRNYLAFPDEDIEMTTGWLLSEGETLYGSVFSHHMPLAVAISQGIAAISPTDEPAHFRAAPWLGYVLLAVAIAFGPSGRRRPVAGRLAGATFLAAISILAPVIWAHMVLNDVFWGIAFSTFLVLLPLPLLVGDEPGQADAVGAGVAAALALAGSPLAAFPLLFSVVLAGVATSREALLRRTAAFLAGASLLAACFAAWLLRFGEVAGFREEVFRFNSVYYSRFLGLSNSTTAVFSSALHRWPLYLSSAIRDPADWDADAMLVPSLVVVAAFVGFAVVRRIHPASWGSVLRAGGLVGLVVLTILSFRIQGTGFRAIPLHLAVVTVAVMLPWSAGLRLPIASGALLALAFGPLFVNAFRHESWAFHSDDRRAVGAWSEVARYIAAHSTPDERIASFPTGAIVYLESHRRPATDSVFFLPWQAAWENESPSRASTCTQLRARAPRFVAVQEATIWGYFPWKSYAACIDQFLKSAYEPVARPELGGLLLQRRNAIQKARTP